MANAGGTSNNKKKHIKEQRGDKGSDAINAAVVSDSVGDSFTNAARPSLDIPIKLESVGARALASPHACSRRYPLRH